MMYNKRTKGAISVFLVIILVPCLLFTSIFVDLSRLSLAKSVAQSAADLSLNALLTHYDYDLNDWYGLMASCQEPEEYIQTSIDYFSRMLVSSGLNKEEVDLITDYWSVVMGTATKTYDFLQTTDNVKKEDESSESSEADKSKEEKKGEGEGEDKEKDTSTTKISSVANANLSNPAMMKDAIVEFMKYRAPLAMLEGIIGHLSGDSSVSSMLENAENEQLVKEKQNFVKAEGELLKAARHTYDQLYNKYWDPGKDYFKSMEEFVPKTAEYKDFYAQLHMEMIENVYGVDELTEYLHPHADPKKLETYTKKDAGTTFNQSKFDKAVQDLSEKLTELGNAMQGWADQAYQFSITKPGSGDNDANPMRWCLLFEKALDKRAKGIMTSYQEWADEAATDVMNAYNYVLAFGQTDGCPSNWNKGAAFVQEVGFVKSWIENYHIDSAEPLAEDNTDVSEVHLMYILEKRSRECLKYAKGSNLKITVNGQTIAANDKLAEIGGYVDGHLQNLKKFSEALDIAINGKGDVKSLDSMKSLAQTQSDSFSKWSSEASQKTTDMKQKDDRIINGNTTDAQEKEESDSIQLAKEITPQRVDELKKRLTAIKKLMDDMIDFIESLKYGSKSLADIKNLTDMTKAAKGKLPDDDKMLTNAEIRKAANESFEKLYQYDQSKADAIKITNDNNPTINPENENEYNVPFLWRFFHEHFAGQDLTGLEQAEKDQKEAEEKAQKKENEKSKGRYHQSGTENVKNEFSADYSFSGFDVLTSLASLIGKLIDLDFKGIRDDLYVTTYIMEMFSYATMEEEGLYHIIEDSEEGDVTNLWLLPFTYRPVEYDSEDYYGKKDGKEEENKGKWLSTLLTDTYNESLTNKKFNKDNNAAYCAEIEYLLYGNENNSKNISETYLSIYGIRYALNLVSSFQNFWTPSGDNTTATAIETVCQFVSGLTSFIIPAVVFKVILLPIYTIFETIRDLDRLEAGFPVEIYKTSYKDWWVKIPSLSGGLSDFVNALSGAGGSDSKKSKKKGEQPAEPIYIGPNQDKGLFYSDYLMLFVYSAIQKEPDDIYRRLANLIGTNMRKQTETPSYSLSKSITYFHLTTDKKMLPLLTGVSLFGSYGSLIDNIKENLGTFHIDVTRGYS